MNKKLLIGNWKMNPATAESAKQILNKVSVVASGLKQTIIVTCPPFVYLHLCQTKSKIENFFIGAQSVSRDEAGSHTGEVSASMLKDMSVEYVIVGHSEERERGEASETVAKKLKLVLDSGMKPVVCIGEKVRDVENGTHFDFLKLQIRETFGLIPKKYAKDIILVYEPVWAIGASEPMVASDICEMVIFIRKVFADIFDANSAMKLTVLYGGSVNAVNADEIITIGKVDGLLVGRESINIPGFIDLMKVVDVTK
jgi:triosephosphate isomerase